MLKTGVQVFGVLADHDQVDVREPRLYAGQAEHGPEVRVELERPADLDVDRGKATANWCADRTLERHAISYDRVENGLWERRSLTL